MTNSFKSLKDLGYQQAKTGDTLTEQAKSAIEMITGFPADITPEAKAELFSGYQLRFNENRPAVTYVIVNGHYIRATEEQIAGGGHAHPFRSAGQKPDCAAFNSQANASVCK